MAMSMTSGMNMPSATSGAMPTSTGMSNMDMSMGGCKISMTWNWYTIGACFISKQWQIKSSGMFAGSCIGVIFLVISLEFLRRTQREFDYLLQRRDQARRTASLANEPAASASDSSSDQDTNIKNPAVVSINAHASTQRVRSPQSTRVALLRRQTVRAVLHTLQFAVAYFVMLLAMYYNGYIIICILIGAFIGSFVFSWDQLLTEERQKHEAADVTGCCG